MRALPARLSAEEQVTGLSCPECYGVLNASVLEPGSHVHFRCRIGHTFSKEEVIAAKEKLFEDYLWTAITALTELGQLLRELTDRERAGDHADAYRQRAELADRQVDALRRLIQDNSPAEIAAEQPETPPSP